MKTNTLTRGFAFLFAVVLCLVPAAAQQDSMPLHPMDQQSAFFYLGDAIDGSSPVTVQTRFELTDQAALNALDGLWLVGLSTSQDTPPSALSVVWSEDRSGWFPVWGLQLQSDLGLLASERSAKAGTGILEGSSYLAVHNVTPQIGHTYQAAISYDPITGWVAMNLTDVTEQTRVFAKAWMLEPVESVDAMYPAIGVVGDVAGVRVEDVKVSPYTVPLGTEWDLALNEGDRYSRLALFRFTPSYDLALRLDPQASDLLGSYAVSVAGEFVDGDEQVIMDSIQAVADEATYLPLSTADLPLGDFTLRLDYTDGTGKTWTIGSRSLLMVAATIDVHFGPLSIDDNALHGTVTLTSQDETLKDASLRIVSVIGEPDPKDPKPSDVVAVHEGQTISQVPSVLPFTIPLDVDERLFSVVLDVEFDVPVGKVMQGNQYHVLLDR